jgi:hypothetical protein
MNTNDFIKKLDAQINDIVKNDKPLSLAIKSLTALQSKRIFLEAKNRSGANIGQYKDREYYINPNKSPKAFTTKGKSGKTKKKNGESYKTGYFANFLDYKKEIGRNKNVDTVDLLLSGELNRAWSNGKITEPMPKKINQHKYQIVLDEFNYDKVERYDAIEVFGMSSTEKTQFLKVLNDELLKALR